MRKPSKMWPITIVFVIIFVFCYIPLVEDYLSIKEDKCTVIKSSSVLQESIYRVYWYVNKSSTHTLHEITDFSPHYMYSKDMQRSHQPGKTYECYVSSYSNRIMWKKPNILLPMGVFITLYLGLFFHSIGLLQPISRPSWCSQCGFKRELVTISPCGCKNLCYKCAKRAKECNMCGKEVKHIRLDRVYNNSINV